MARLTLLQAADKLSRISNELKGMRFKLPYADFNEDARDENYKALVDLMEKAEKLSEVYYAELNRRNGLTERLDERAVVNVEATERGNAFHVEQTTIEYDAGTLEWGIPSEYDAGTLEWGIPSSKLTGRAIWGARMPWKGPGNMPETLPDRQDWKGQENEKVILRDILNGSGEELNGELRAFMETVRDELTVPYSKEDAICGPVFTCNPFGKGNVFFYAYSPSGFGYLYVTAVLK